MKAKELMLDDWVMAYGKKTQVVWTGNVKKLAVRGFPSEFFEDEISFIPITSEILVKNGFVLESEGWVYYKNPKLKEQDYICISFKHNGETRSVEINFMHKAQCVFRHIYDVHELQHAFRLCGITKEIEL